MYSCVSFVSWIMSASSVQECQRIRKPSEFQRFDQATSHIDNLTNAHVNAVHDLTHAYQILALLNVAWRSRLSSEGLLVVSTSLHVFLCVCYTVSDKLFQIVPIGNQCIIFSLKKVLGHFSKPKPFNMLDIDELWIGNYLDIQLDGVNISLLQL